jgi:hypothetical protein
MFSRYGVNQSSKQLIKKLGISILNPARYGRAQMGWIAALVTIPALIMLGAMLWHPEGDKGWRDQAEGLRERLEREGFPRL